MSYRSSWMCPLVVAMVMLVGTAIMGLLGALLSVPIAGAVQVVAHDILRRRDLTGEVGIRLRGW